jgi:hypothetical protein
MLMNQLRYIMVIGGTHKKNKAEEWSRRVVVSELHLLRLF